MWASLPWIRTVTPTLPWDWASSYTLTCPHLADIKHRKLHAFKGYAGPASLAGVLVCDLNMADMEAILR